MNTTDEAARQDEAPREPDAALRAAILRIGSSLDVDTVIEQAVESGRALTGARYGIITTVDDSGRPLDSALFGRPRPAGAAAPARPRRPHPRAPSALVVDSAA